MKRAAFLRRMAMAALASAFIDVERLLPTPAHTPGWVPSEGARNLVGNKEAFAEWMKEEMRRELERQERLIDAMYRAAGEAEAEGKYLTVPTSWS